MSNANKKLKAMPVKGGGYTTKRHFVLNPDFLKIETQKTMHT